MTTDRPLSHMASLAQITWLSGRGWSVWERLICAREAVCERGQSVWERLICVREAVLSDWLRQITWVSGRGRVQGSQFSLKISLSRTDRPLLHLCLSHLSLSCNTGSSLAVSCERANQDKEREGPRSERGRSVRERPIFYSNSTSDMKYQVC